jgi:pimeloyl-ACP methyl ester carboxylesterase
MLRAMIQPSHVVVLHGWGLSSFATRYWCHRLRQAGFTPSPFAYRSLARTLNHNVAQLAAHIEALPGAGPVHLVGHSMGGIMIMQYLATHLFARLGRVVMVGTPFQGSASAQKLQLTKWGHFLLGKSIVQWAGVDARDMPPGLEVGTIAGTRPLGMGQVVGKLIGRSLNQMETPHDGTVSLRETDVPFAVDKLVLHVTHSEMLVSAAVTAQIVRFLNHGKFLRP